MTLIINTQDDEKRQLNVTVEVPEQRVQTAIQASIRDLRRKARIPGFRPGKAPYQLIVNYAGGAQAVRQEAIQDMLEPVFQEAMVQIDAEPYATPKVVNVEFEPFVIELVIPLEPTIVLGDYRAQRRDIDAITIAEDAVDEAIEQIRERNAVTEPVDRAAEAGDIVTIAGEAFLGDDTEDMIFNEDRFETKLSDDNVFPGTSFVENLIGGEAGDERSFSITFPEDDEEDWRGQDAHFTVTILDVKSRQLPELDDELAQIEGEETLEALREAIAKQLQEQAEAQAKGDLFEDLVKSLLDNVEELVYGPVLLEYELDGMVDDMRTRIERIGMEFQQFLDIQSKTEDDLREDWEEDAVDQLEKRLVLGKFVELEQLNVSTEEVEEELDRFLATAGDDEQSRHRIQEYLVESGGASIVNNLMSEKVIARYRAILSGEAPDLDAEELAQEELAQADDLIETVDEDAATDDDAAESADEMAEVEIEVEAEADDVDAEE